MGFHQETEPTRKAQKSPPQVRSRERPNSHRPNSRRPSSGPASPVGRAVALLLTRLEQPLGSQHEKLSGSAFFQTFPSRPSALLGPRPAGHLGSPRAVLESVLSAPEAAGSSSGHAESPGKGRAPASGRSGGPRWTTAGPLPSSARQDMGLHGPMCQRARSAPARGRARGRPRPLVRLKKPWPQGHPATQTVGTTGIVHPFSSSTGCW